jgi:hypothetical protein
VAVDFIVETMIPMSKFADAQNAAPLGMQVCLHRPIDPKYTINTNGSMTKHSLLL